MGFSSYTCAKTNIPFAAGPHVSQGDASLSDVVIVFAEGPSVAGSYDGYGRVRGASVHDMAAGKLRSQISNGSAKVVLAAFHDPERDAVETLGKNRPDPAQGVHEPAFLRACHEAGGFTSFEGYVLAQGGIAPPRIAARLGRAEAQSVVATQTALREMVSEIRMAALASEGASFAGNGRIYPSLLAIRPDEGGEGRWVAAPDREKAKFYEWTVGEAVEGACREVVLAVGEKPAGRRDVRAAAARLVEGLPVVDEARVSLIRDGDAVGEARTRSCPLGGRWYEVRIEDEPARAFLNPADAGRALGLEDVSDLREALWSRNGAPGEVELPTAASPSP